jgi:hypothetical protein
MNLPIFNHHDYQAESSRSVLQHVVSAHQSRGPSQNTDVVGRPIHFVGGQFAGQTVRAELHEVQKADLGRKYARVDRRPLDPPPAVLLRLFHVYNAGTDLESEKEVQNYDEVQNLGLVCTVDLFPVPGPTDSPRGKDLKDSPTRRTVAAPCNQTPYSSSLPQSPPYPQQEPHQQQSFKFVTSNPYSTTSQQPQSPPGSRPFSTAHITSAAAGFLPPSSSADIVHHLGDFPVTESSKLTHALVGATFVQPANVDYQGKKALMFVFADLAVKIEGTFILRYRMFDIFSQCFGTPDLVIQAECYGGTFRVYSTKEFPGLQASTDLTKQLARWGVRLNIRETERKRRKKGDRRSPSPTFGDGDNDAAEGKSPDDGSGND